MCVGEHSISSTLLLSLALQVKSAIGQVAEFHIFISQITRHKFVTTLLRNDRFSSFPLACFYFLAFFFQKTVKVFFTYFVLSRTFLTDFSDTGFSQRKLHMGHASIQSTIRTLHVSIGLSYYHGLNMWRTCFCNILPMK